MNTIATDIRVFSASATWALIIALLVASLLLVAFEDGPKWIRRRRDERKKERARAKKKGKGKRGKPAKKRGHGLLDCRHCHKRYTGPRHVCRLSWKQMQKVRKS